MARVGVVRGAGHHGRLGAGGREAHPAEPVHLAPDVQRVHADSHLRLVRPAGQWRGRGGAGGDVVSGGGVIYVVKDLWFCQKMVLRNSLLMGVE